MTSGYFCRRFEGLLEDGNFAWNNLTTAEINEEACNDFHASRSVYLDRFGEEHDSDGDLTEMLCDDHEEYPRWHQNMETRAALLLTNNMRLCPECETWWMNPTDWIDHRTDDHEGEEPTYVDLQAPPNPALTNQYTDRRGRTHRFDRDRVQWIEIPSPRAPVRRLSDAFEPYAAYEEPF